jgi:protein TonB
MDVDVPPPAPAPPAPRKIVRVGGSIKEPQKIRHVAPVYPAIAQAAGVQGTVILETVIGEDGRVRNLRVLRPVPLLDEAAVNAVRQWQFTPTLLNGEPVPVVMTVTVTFTLQR